MAKNKHTLSVKARGADSFRRAGIKFHREATDLNAADLTPEQLAAIRAEHGRGLHVVEAGADEQKDDGKAATLEVLVGTDKLPAQVQIAEGIEVPLGDIVAIAFTAALATPALGVTNIDAWNAASFGEQRDELLLETVETLKADPSIYQAFVDERAKQIAKADKTTKPGKAQGAKK